MCLGLCISNYGASFLTLGALGTLGVSLMTLGVTLTTFGVSLITFGGADFLYIGLWLLQTEGGSFTFTEGFLTSGSFT